MQTVAIDESLTHGDHRVLVVAATVTTTRQFSLLCNDWGPVAATYKDGYHATDGKDKDNLFLAELMLRRIDAFIVTIFELSEYEAAVPQSVRGRIGGEYLAGLKTCIGYLNYALTAASVRRARILIETGYSKGESAARIFLSSLVKFPDVSRIGDVQWVGKENLCTHTADLTAYTFGRMPGKKAIDDIRSRLLPKTKLYRPKRDEIAEMTQLVDDYLRQNREAKRAINKQRRDAGLNPYE